MQISCGLCGHFSKAEDGFVPRVTKYTSDIRATVYYYIRELARDLPAGDALFYARQSKSATVQMAWENNFVSNIYGDPSVKILPPGFSSTDTDGDSLDDYDEINRHGDPGAYVEGIDTDPHNPDTDGDGVNDGDEVLQGFTPVDPSDNRATVDAGPDQIVPADPDGCSSGEVVVMVNGRACASPSFQLVAPAGIFSWAPAENLPVLSDCNRAAGFGDLDNDGDLYLIRDGDIRNYNRIYRFEQTGSQFVRVGQIAYKTNRKIVLPADFDSSGDGLLDLFAPVYLTSGDYPAYLIQTTPDNFEDQGGDNDWIPAGFKYYDLKYIVSGATADVNLDGGCPASFWPIRRICQLSVHK